MTIFGANYEMPVKSWVVLDTKGVVQNPTTKLHHFKKKKDAMEYLLQQTGDTEPSIERMDSGEYWYYPHSDNGATSIIIQKVTERNQKELYAELKEMYATA